MKLCYWILALLIVCLTCELGEAQIINTVVGNGIRGHLGDGGTATAAELSIPARVTFDISGNLYIADGYGNRIRKVSTSGIITTVAGNGSPTYSGDGGPAINAGLNPDGIAVDAAGNMYISDVGNNRIRKVTGDGIITTYAGNGLTTSGANGDGGPATAAIVNGGIACTLDASGNLYISDGEFRVRKITPAGIITTVVGNGVRGWGGDGGSATAAMIAGVGGITFDADDNMYITDAGNFRVRKISNTGVISTIAGTGLTGYTGDGGPATNATFGYNLFGIVIDRFGNLFVSDYSNNVVRRISSDGVITTLAGNGIQGYAGDGGPATAAELYDNRGLGIDTCGNVYIVDEQNNRIREVSFPHCNYLSSETIQSNNDLLSVFPNPASYH